MEQQASPQREQALAFFRSEQTRIQKELEELKTRDRELRFELKRVRSTLGLYGEGEATRSSPKPTLADADVLAVVEAQLADGPLPVDELKGRVLKHARANGFSGTGLHLTLPRVLKDARFREAAEGYALTN